jgi:hypothetical protein
MFLSVLELHQRLVLLAPVANCCVKEQAAMYSWLVELGHPPVAACHLAVGQANVELLAASQSSLLRVAQVVM